MIQFLVWKKDNKKLKLSARENIALFYCYKKIYDTENPEKEQENELSLGGGDNEQADKQKATNKENKKTQMDVELKQKLYQIYTKTIALNVYDENYEVDEKFRPTKSCEPLPLFIKDTNMKDTVAQRSHNIIYSYEKNDNITPLAMARNILGNIIDDPHVNNCMYQIAVVDDRIKIVNSFFFDLDIIDSNMRFEALTGTVTEKGNRHVQLNGIKPEEFKHIIDERCCVEPEEFCMIANYRFLNSNFLSGAQKTDKEQLQKMMNEYIVYLSSLLIGLVSKYTYLMSPDEARVKRDEGQQEQLSINLGKDISKNLLTKNFHNNYINNNGELKVFFKIPGKTDNKEEQDSYKTYDNLIKKLEKYIKKLVVYRDQKLGEFVEKYDKLQNANAKQDILLKQAKIVFSSENKKGVYSYYDIDGNLIEAFVSENNQIVLKIKEEFKRSDDTDINDTILSIKNAQSSCDDNLKKHETDKTFEIENSTYCEHGGQYYQLVEVGESKKWIRMYSDTIDTGGKTTQVMLIGKRVFLLDKNQNQITSKEIKEKEVKEMNKKETDYDKVMRLLHTSQDIKQKDKKGEYFQLGGVKYYILKNELYKVDTNSDRVCRKLDDASRKALITQITKAAIDGITKDFVVSDSDNKNNSPVKYVVDGKTYFVQEKCVWLFNENKFETPSQEEIDITFFNKLKQSNLCMVYGEDNYFSYNNGAQIVKYNEKIGFQRVDIQKNKKCQEEYQNIIKELSNKNFEKDSIILEINGAKILYTEKGRCFIDDAGSILLNSDKSELLHKPDIISILEQLYQAYKNIVKQRYGRNNVFKLEDIAVSPNNEILEINYNDEPQVIDMNKQSQKLNEQKDINKKSNLVFRISKAEDSNEIIAEQMEQRELDKSLFQNKTKEEQEESKFDIDWQHYQITSDGRVFLITEDGLRKQLDRETAAEKMEKVIEENNKQLERVEAAKKMKQAIGEKKIKNLDLNNFTSSYTKLSNFNFKDQKGNDVDVFLDARCRFYMQNKKIPHNICVASHNEMENIITKLKKSKSYIYYIETETKKFENDYGYTISKTIQTGYILIGEKFYQINDNTSFIREVSPEKNEQMKQIIEQTKNKTPITITISVNYKDKDLNIVTDDKGGMYDIDKDKNVIKMISEEEKSQVIEQQDCIQLCLETSDSKKYNFVINFLTFQMKCDDQIVDMEYIIKDLKQNRAKNNCIVLKNNGIETLLYQDEKTNLTYSITTEGIKIATPQELKIFNKIKEWNEKQKKVKQKQQEQVENNEDGLAEVAPVVGDSLATPTDEMQIVSIDLDNNENNIVFCNGTYYFGVPDELYKDYLKAIEKNLLLSEKEQLIEKERLQIFKKNYFMLNGKLHKSQYYFFMLDGEMYNPEYADQELLKKYSDIQEEMRKPIIERITGKYCSIGGEPYKITKEGTPPKIRISKPSIIHSDPVLTILGNLEHPVFYYKGKIYESFKTLVRKNEVEQSPDNPYEAKYRPVLKEVLDNELIKNIAKDYKEKEAEISTVNIMWNRYYGSGKIIPMKPIKNIVYAIGEKGKEEFITLNMTTGELKRVEDRKDALACESGFALKKLVMKERERKQKRETRNLNEEQYQKHRADVGTQVKSSTRESNYVKMI